MASVPLPTPQVLRQLLRYEPETGRLYWRERSIEHFVCTASHSAEEIRERVNAKLAGREAFTASHNQGYKQGCVLYRQLLAHRVIWAMVHDHWPTFIDHINGDRADNRLSNLREVTRTENQRNQKLNSKNTSGHMGVSRAAHGWQAYIKVNHEHIHLGTFADKSDAIATRRKAEIKHGFHKGHGQR